VQNCKSAALPARLILIAQKWAEYADEQIVRRARIVIVIAVADRTGAMAVAALIAAHRPAIAAARVGGIRIAAMPMGIACMATMSGAAAQPMNLHGCCWKADGLRSGGRGCLGLESKESRKGQACDRDDDFSHGTHRWLDGKTSLERNSSIFAPDILNNLMRMTIFRRNLREIKSARPKGEAPFPKSMHFAAE